MTARSHNGEDTDKDAWGIVLGHAFTVAGTKVLSDGTKLVRARNPWGNDEYRGEKGVESETWTDKLLKEVPDAKGDEDGYIYLPVEQFKVSFKMIEVNYNASKMYMDYYMKFNDKPSTTPPDSEATEAMAPKCGTNCILRKVHVVSSKA